jgi:Ca2+/Na+ antiporter
MALGSSAPEILLTIIETMTTINNDDPGELGPATIVGSAAFNLLGISLSSVFNKSYFRNYNCVSSNRGTQKNR